MAGKKGRKKLKWTKPKNGRKLKNKTGKKWWQIERTNNGEKMDKKTFKKIKRLNIKKKTWQKKGRKWTEKWRKSKIGLKIGNQKSAGNEKIKNCEKSIKTQKTEGNYRIGSKNGKKLKIKMWEKIRGKMMKK